MSETQDQLLIEFEQQERWRDLLGEVLAALNGDGGHYQTEHGAGRAAIEGISSHYQMLTTIDVLQAENARLREQVEALAEALEELQATVQATCEGGQVDIPGLEILGEALDEADAALRAYREANHG